MRKDLIFKELENQKARSKWDKAVILYAYDLIESREDITEFELTTLYPVLLNGADNWKHYSYIGNSLVYNIDIAERVLTPSELKRYKNTNWSIDLLKVQARALFQAYHLIKNIIIHN